MTSHAAVVARGMGKPCVCGCEALLINYNAKLFRAGAVEVKEGDLISIDGTTGSVILGEVKMIAPELSDEFRILLDWADQIRRLGVRANADTPLDAERSRQFGAEGVGLCRTEHMFMASDRLPIVHEMIMSETIEERTVALDKLLPMQQGDFYGILKAMDGLPVTIRLLDPPLHEFLPNTEELAIEIAKLRLTNGDPGEIERKDAILRRARQLHEFNPMLGFRGVRLAVRYPEAPADKLFAASEASSKVIPEINRFFWASGGNDLAWFPEACLSHPKHHGFYTVKDFMNGATTPGSGIMNIREYTSAVSQGAPATGITPPQVADQLRADATQALKLLDAMPSPGSDKELRLTLGDLRAMAYLGEYYADKIMGATELASYGATHDAQRRASSVRYLQSAVEDWKQYAAIATRQYRPQLLTRVGYVDLNELTAKVEHDVQIANE